MFDYAMLTRLLETHIDNKSEYFLFVCPNKISAKRFSRYNKDKIEKGIILTIDEIWKHNRLTGLRYYDYRILT